MRSPGQFSAEKNVAERLMPRITLKIAFDVLLLFITSLERLIMKSTSHNKNRSMKLVGLSNERIMIPIAAEGYTVKQPLHTFLPWMTKKWSSYLPHSGW